MSRSWIAAASCAVVGCILANNAQAGQVVLDFNDLTAGNLSGQAGGTGMTGSWAGTTNPQVVSGDLTAPASTHYALAQSAGTPQSIRTTVSSTSATGQDYRSTAATLGGTVWFSFLVNPNDSNSRAGISFNTSGSSASGARIDVNGSSLFVSYGAGSNLSSTQTTNANHLFVGEIVVDESGTSDHLRLWIDPDVQTLNESTTAGRILDGTGSDWVGSGITAVAVQSYGNSSSGGTVDAIRVSNDPTAQIDVTGFGTPTPEPGSLALCALGAGTLLARRRRQSR
jgi:hypothetical protein